MAIYSGFSHWKWWFSIAMLVHQRVNGTPQVWYSVWFILGRFSSSQLGESLPNQSAWRLQTNRNCAYGWGKSILYTVSVYMYLSILYICVCVYISKATTTTKKTEKQWTTSESLKFGAGPFGSCLRHQRPNFSCSPSWFNPGWPKGQVFLAKCLSSVNPSVTIPSGELSFFYRQEMQNTSKKTYEA